MQDPNITTSGEASAVDWLKMSSRTFASARRTLVALAVLTAAAATFLVGGGAATTASCPAGAAAVLSPTLTVSGGVATATFSIAPGCEGITVSLASYKTPAATFAVPQTLADAAGGSYSSGDAPPLTVTVPDCFYQVDLVLGTTIPTITNSTVYGTRKILFENGGSQKCGTTPPITPPQPPSNPPTTPPPGGGILPITATTVDMTITKVADHNSVVVGRQVTYSIAVKNNGTAAAANVTVTDTLPPGESLVSTAGATCSGSPTITCSFGTVAAGASASVTVVTLAQSMGTKVNTATVTTTTTETNTANNSAQATVEVTGAFKPAKAACGSLVLKRRILLTAKRVPVVATVVDQRRKPIKGAAVELKGPGILIVRRTDKTGVARFSIKPRKAGVLRIRIVQSKTCGAGPAYLAVRGAFLPPKLTG
jgi:uncharacterized repeat protein (TIGR01451 family)